MSLDTIIANVTDNGIKASLEKGYIANTAEMGVYVPGSALADGATAAN